MKIGILTGGGDCPGLNAVIRAVVRKGTFHYEDEFVGFMEGWRGVLEDKIMELSLSTVGGILPRGGTILRTSRTNPAKHEGGLQLCIDNLKKHGCDALIAIGGDDTLSVAKKLFDSGVKVVGVPKTIDNDLAGTDFTFGFDTAVNVATGAIDRVHTTAEAHNRVIVVEVMGRDSGWIATYSGIGGGADVILIPEVPFDIEEVAELIRQRHARGRYFSIVVAAEGARFKGHDVETQNGGSAGRDEFGHLRLGGIGADGGARDRKTDWLRVAVGCARTYPAGRIAQRFRPRAGHSLRTGRHRHGAPRRIRANGGAAGKQDYFHPAGGSHRFESQMR